MIAARYASLLAFAQSRGADCGRDDGGRFGDGNKCQVTDGVLKPGTAEPHDSEPSFKDEDDDHVYHVTTADNAESILSGGFKQSPHTVKGGSYESYSKGKVFFTEKSGLATWKSKIEDHLFHSHDDPPPVAIVKVKKSEVEHLLKPDTIGSKDAGAKSYYVDLSGKKKEGRGFCPTGEGGGVDNSCGSDELSQPKVGERLSREGVRFSADGDATPTAIRAVDKGVSALLRNDLPLPDSIVIGECHPGALAQTLPYGGRQSIVISKKLSLDKVSSQIKSGYLAGDPKDPLSSLVVHEASHVEHYGSLASAIGAELDSDQAEVAWHKLTGSHDISVHAESGTAPTKSRQEYSWSPEYRPVSNQLASLSASDAIMYAKEVSGYAATNPLEFVAEFRTGVAGGMLFSGDAWSLYEAYAGPSDIKKLRK